MWRNLSRWSCVCVALFTFDCKAAAAARGACNVISMEPYSSVYACWSRRIELGIGKEKVRDARFCHADLPGSPNTDLMFSLGTAQSELLRQQHQHQNKHRNAIPIPRHRVYLKQNVEKKIIIRSLATGLGPYWLLADTRELQHLLVSYPLLHRRENTMGSWLDVHRVKRVKGFSFLTSDYGLHFMR